MQLQYVCVYVYVCVCVLRSNAQMRKQAALHHYITQRRAPSGRAAQLHLAFCTAGC